MDFKKIQTLLTERDPYSFLTLAIAEEQEDDPFFIFQTDIEKTLETNIQFLTSAETLSLDELTYWKEHDFLVVCQTIDGDFIGGNLDETFIIPQSLYKTDIEIFPFFLSDFFVAYEQGKIGSIILPAVPKTEE